jgi:Rrf2 family protein
MRALSHLARSYADSKNMPVSIKEICKSEKFSNRYLENIFVKLRKAGLVKSLKGEKGGFMLAKNPAEISVYDILTAVETDVAPSRCSVDVAACANAKNCGIRGVWMGLNVKMKEYLEETSLEQIKKLHFGSNGKK